MLQGSGEVDEEEGFSKQERQLLQNRRALDDAKQQAFECEDVAKDIKYNLRSQSEKLEKSTMSTLYYMQKDLTQSDRILKLIDWERKKNKYVIAGVFIGLTLLLIVIMFLLYS